MWDAIAKFFEGRSIEGFVSSILLVAAIVYYIPKGILWWYRARKYGPPDIPSDHHKPKGPQDYL